MNTTVGQLLEVKGKEIWSVSANDSVFKALEIMADKRIGALLVVEEKRKLVGIFSERDYARRIILEGRASKDTTVGAVMTREVITISPEDSIRNCLVLMTDRHIRHLPVISYGRLMGIITIGDVVKQIISDQAFTIQEMEKYFTTAG